MPNNKEYAHRTSAFISDKIPDSFIPYLVNNELYIHSHDHPVCVLKAIVNGAVPHGCIALNEAQRINSKVCVGINQQWTVYKG